jgi:hypothetical protein
MLGMLRREWTGRRLLLLFREAIEVVDELKSLVSALGHLRSTCVPRLPATQRLLFTNLPGILDTDPLFN